MSGFTTASRCVTTVIKRPREEGRPAGFPDTLTVNLENGPAADISLFVGVYLRFGLLLFGNNGGDFDRIFEGIRGGAMLWTKVGGDELC